MPRALGIGCNDHLIVSVAGIAPELKDEHVRQVSLVHSRLPEHAGQKNSRLPLVLLSLQPSRLAVCIPVT